MEIIYSKTGSKGNASIISDGKTLIQIDAGIDYKTVNKCSNYRLNDVSGLFATHIHQDHIKNLNEYLKLGLSVFANKEVIDKVSGKNKIHKIKEIESLSQIEVGTFKVKPFDVYHVNTDGSDCDNKGFFIYSTETKEKMVWITDAAYIENKFPALDYICIECNYIDVDDYSKELEYVNKFVEKRRFNSHLSLSRCIDFLKKQDLSKIKWIKLLHITETQGNIEQIILSKLHHEFPDIKFII